jgi:hypothetical protein
VPPWIHTTGTLPDEMNNPSQDLLVSTDGFGPAFDWGASRATAEAALGAAFTVDDLSGGCQQAYLAGIPHVTFTIEEGLVTAVSVQGVFDIGPIPTTDTGLTIGDPVIKVTSAYPDAVEDTDPSDAFTTRWTAIAGDRTAQILSHDNPTVSYMQFGLTGSVGHGQCA